MTNNNNPWKYVKPRDVSNNPYFKKGEEKEQKDSSDSPPTVQESTTLMDGIYTLMPKTNNYAKGVEALNVHLKNNPSTIHPQFELPDKSKIYRPLTFKENIEARVNEYNRDNNLDGSKRTFEQKIELFNTWIDSCTGIAYKKYDASNNNPVTFKIIPI